VLCSFATAKDTSEMGHYTDAPEDNLLGITDQNQLNEQEALGVATAETYILEELDFPVELSAYFIQRIHRIAFGHLYEWAGKWRTTVPNVGAYVPPEAEKVPMLMYEFGDELRFRQSKVDSANQNEVAELLAYAHHKLVHIHPFTNGNGRTARLLTNVLAYNNGYREVVLYTREQGDSRNNYLQAIRLGDIYDLGALADLIKHQLKRLE
jgi:cell filamentation protein